MKTSNNLTTLIKLLDSHERGILTLLQSFTFDRKGKIITCGNGGSACEAAHLTEELIGKYDKPRPPINSLCLSSDAMGLTCISNDFGYQYVFSRQIEAVCSVYDTVVFFTTSGNSENIYNGILAALKKNAKNIIVLSGKTGGKCKWLSLNNNSVKEIIVESDSSARIQEVHQFIMHELVEKAERELL